MKYHNASGQGEGTEQRDLGVKEVFVVVSVACTADV